MVVVGRRSSALYFVVLPSFGGKVAEGFPAKNRALRLETPIPANFAIYFGGKATVEIPACDDSTQTVDIPYWLSMMD